jgi:hypothetical protein
MAVLYVGIVEGVEPGAVALAVVDDGFSQDDGSGGMAAQLFQLELTHLNEYWVPQPDGRKTFHPTPDIYEISAFLTNESASATVRGLPLRYPRFSILLAMCWGLVRPRRYRPTPSS